MILYHGSTVVVDKPEIRRGSGNLDFGTGFYTTTSYEQAERWTRTKMRRSNLETGYVCFYEFDLETAEQAMTIKRFDNADIEWLNFVADNRRGKSQIGTVDLHIGPVANDNVYQTIRLFETGAYDAEYTIKRLKTENLHNQWTLHTDRIIALCRFVRAEEVRQVIR